MKTYVFFTIDTEVSMGGALDHDDLEPLSVDTCVWCRQSDRGEHGIRTIMDILESYGLVGVFFVDSSLNDMFNTREFQSICQSIASRGHDLQLHLHPAKQYYAEFRSKGSISGRANHVSDLLRNYNLEAQVALIEKACRTFEDVSGRFPVAFRAGCYGVSEDTLSILAQAGIVADFSCNAAFNGITCGVCQSMNKAYRVRNITEFPVTQLIGNRWPGSGYRPLEVSSISSEEMCYALAEINGGGQRVASIVFHSFSLLKHRTNRWEKAKPDLVVRDRLHSLARFLVEHSDRFEVARISDCVRNDDFLEYVTGGSEVWPKTKWKFLIRRYLEQFRSRI
jgi:hypothetical protein